MCVPKEGYDMFEDMCTLVGRSPGEEISRRGGEEGETLPSAISANVTSKQKDPK